MSAAPEMVEDDVALVTLYCERRSTDDYRIEHSVRGSSITIVE